MCFLKSCLSVVTETYLLAWKYSRDLASNIRWTKLIISNKDDDIGQTVTSLLRFNTNQSYSESMSGGKGVAAVTLQLKRILLSKLIFIFPGKNQPLVPKMECHHHHTGNRTIIFHLPFRLVSYCFLAAPRSQSVRGWPVRLAKFLSDRGTKEEVSAITTVVSCLTERWRTAATNV